MFKKEHLKCKIIAFVLLDLLVSTVYFGLASMPDGANPSMLYLGFHFELLLVYFPLTALVYGCAAAICAFCDYGYMGLMSVIFAVCALIGITWNDICIWQGAFIFIGIMLGALILTQLVILLVRAIIKSDRTYKMKKEEK